MVDTFNMLFGLFSPWRPCGHMRFLRLALSVGLHPQVFANNRHDFCSHTIMHRMEEPNRLQILFLGERATFIWGEITKCVRPQVLALHRRSHQPPKQCKYVEMTTQDAGKILQDSLLRPEYRAEQPRNYFCASGYMLFCKF